MRAIGFPDKSRLWTLLEEAGLIRHHLAAGAYEEWYLAHLDNATHRPLIDKALEMFGGAVPRSQGQ
jgi:hypothetical protein